MEGLHSFFYSALSLLIVPLALALRCVVSVSHALRVIAAGVEHNEQHRQSNDHITEKTREDVDVFASGLAAIWLCIRHFFAALLYSLQDSESFHVIADFAYLVIAFANLSFLRGCFAVLTEYIFL